MNAEALRRIEENKRTKSSVLDLFNLDLTELPKEISELRHLKELDLSSTQIQDITVLKQLTQLTILDLSSTQIQDITVLKQLTQLTSLSLYNTKIQDISFLKDLTQLQELFLNNTQIQDISILKELTQLISLDLSGSQIQDISILKELTQLISLDLSGSQIQDISILKELIQLEFLNLSINEIQDISCLKNLKQLTSLDLSNNQIQNISCLKNLKQLTSLDLSDNKIEDISCLKDLKQLISLFLSDNQIQDISCLKDLTLLQELFLNNTKIQDISFLKDLTQLQELFLNNTQIQDISFLKDLTQLQELFLNNTQIQDISFLKDLTQLISLELSGSQIQDISALKELINIDFLDLSNNQIQDISILKELIRLEFLNLSRNEIQDISCLKNLKQLTSLFLSSTQIQDISCLKNLKQLTSLFLSSTQIQDISCLKELTQLTRLDLSSTQIQDISCLKEFTQLTRLDLSSTQIQDISALKELTNLKYLNLSNNNITFLPNFFQNFKELISFQYHDNPFSKYLLPLKTNNPQSVIRYILDTQQNSRPLREAKVVLVGEGNVGKTTLLGWLLEGKQHSTSRTDKIEIRHDEHSFFILNKDGEKENLKIHFWDFGGQEIMHATHKFFMTERCVYVLVINHRENENEQEKLDKWIELLKTTIGDSPIILVANQCDKPTDKHRLPDREIQKEFPNVILPVIETSGETGRGIHLLKKAIQDALQTLEILQTLLPVPFYNAKNELEQLKCDYIPYEKFEEVCHQISLNKQYDFSKDMQSLLAGLLNDLGVLLNYQNKNEDLEELFIFNPEWIVNGVYSLIIGADGQKASHKGILEAEIAHELLKEKGYVKPKERRFILEMLKSFQLSYENILNGTRYYYIPSVFELQKPEKFEEAWGNPNKVLHFRFNYENWRNDFINYIIVREHEHIKEELFWKEGVMLQYEYDNKKNLVKVISERKKKRISLQIQGEADLKITLSHFRAIVMPKIHEKFTNLGAKEYVVYTEGQKEEEISYEDLIEHEKLGWEKYRSTVFRKEIPVHELLGNVDFPVGSVESKVFDYVKLEEIQKAQFIEENPDVIPTLRKFELVEDSDLIQENLKQEKGKVRKKRARKRTLLMLTANPDNRTVLNLKKEHSKMVEKLQKSKLNVLLKGSINKTEFREQVEEEAPNILHFSGHGAETDEVLKNLGFPNGGLILHNEEKNGYFELDVEKLKVLFEHFKGEGVNIEVLVLNACYSAELAQEISRIVPYVIGTNTSIDDEHAISFSVGFYFKLSKNLEDIESAFRSGRVEAQTSGAKKEDFVIYKEGVKLDL
jgi:small GTP-binding protein